MVGVTEGERGHGGLGVAAPRPWVPAFAGMTVWSGSPTGFGDGELELGVRRVGGPSASLRGCECFEVPLLLTGVLLVESALWNFHRVEYLFRQGTLR